MCSRLGRIPAWSWPSSGSSARSSNQTRHPTPRSGSSVAAWTSRRARSGETAIYSEFGFQGALIANNLVDRAATLGLGAIARDHGAVVVAEEFFDEGASDFRLQFEGLRGELLARKLDQIDTGIGDDIENDPANLVHGQHLARTDRQVDPAQNVASVEPGGDVCQFKAGGGGQGGEVRSFQSDTAANRFAARGQVLGVVRRGARFS